jgi:hypothetical protein
VAAVNARLGLKAGRLATTAVRFVHLPFAKNTHVQSPDTYWTLPSLLFQVLGTDRMVALSEPARKLFTVRVGPLQSNC